MPSMDSPLPEPHSNFKIAVVGSGPAGLMAATHLSADSGNEVHLFEKRSGLGRKLLIAGSSGLNISHHLEAEAFAKHYEGFTRATWKDTLADFGTTHWIQFIEHELGLETFLGTSDRYFVREMKASQLLKKWTELLRSRGVQIHSTQELVDFSSEREGISLTFNEGPAKRFASAIFALGGASWETETPAWAELFRGKGIGMVPFSPRNVGYTVDWKPALLAEAEGKPLKKIRFESTQGSKSGELVITEYGLEGTPVYFYGETGQCFIDLKPDLTLDQVTDKLKQVRENLSPIRRAKQKLALSEAALALLFHHLPNEDRADLDRFARAVKRFPITLGSPRPLSEAISSSGGVALSELTPDLELKKFPGVYCGGEMLDWHAPTGGFLIQACVSMGTRIAKAVSHSARRI
ncbi:MAG: TIGR03862 family flavoprotein [Cryobacterium sp.]|nr:TIGR03862 family flavoprotein [Oligoflexia bacterium]